MLMARFVDVPSAVPARVELVSRLLAFLPHEAVAPGPAANGSGPMTATPAVGPALFWVIALVALLALVGGLGRGD
jgi:hypothetical protein